MEDIHQFLRKQFCNDIEFAAKGSTAGLIKALKSDLQLYNDSEILEYINSKRLEIRNHLEGSKFKYLFTLSNIETNLKECLIDYFMTSPISFTKKIEFSNSIGIGTYKINPLDGTLTVNTQRWNYCSYDYPIFSQLDEFMSLAEYIACGNFFLELNRLDKGIRKKIKAEEQKQEEALDAEARILGQNNNEILVQIPLTENIINKTNKESDQGPLIKQKTTIDFLIGNETEKQLLLEFLLKTYREAKGKSIALMLAALQENKLIAYNEKSELYIALRVDFGSIGSDAGINKYWTDERCNDEKYQEIIAPHTKRIRIFIDNLPRIVV